MREADRPWAYSQRQETLPCLSDHLLIHTHAYTHRSHADMNFDFKILAVTGMLAKAKLKYDVKKGMMSHDKITKEKGHVFTFKLHSI